MVHIGNTPASNFASVTKDTFSGNGSTTAFTLSKTGTTNGVAVFVENVRQIPTTAYAVSGTTLTFTAAPVSGTNNIYVLHHNTPASTATHPASQALTATSGTFTGDVTVDTDTLKVDASEDTVCINTTDTNFDAGADDLIVGSGSGDSGITIYTGANVGDKGSIFFADATVGSSAEKKGQISYEQNNEIMTFFTNDTLAMQIDLNGHITMPLQSAFCATMSANMNNIGLNTNTDIAYNTERFDQNGDYNHTNYTFTAPVTGRYQLQFYIRFDQIDQDTDHLRTRIVTSNRTYETRIVDPSSYDIDVRYHANGGSVLADMDAGDTATAQFFHHNSGNAQVDLSEGHFSGFLVC